MIYCTDSLMVKCNFMGFFIGVLFSMKGFSKKKNSNFFCINVKKDKLLCKF